MANYPGQYASAYRPVGGNLPWTRGSGGAGVAAAAGGDVAGVGAAYDTAYNNALAMNQANYQNILAGYNEALVGQTTAQQAIQSGYSNLYNDVMAKIDSVGQARRDAIDRDSDRFLARQSQQLIDRGLGNTTVQASVGRGVEADRNARQLELSDQLARMSGDYMSRLGLEGLQNQQRGAENQTSLMGRQLDWMNSVNAPYPDATLYARMAQMAGDNADDGGGAFAGSNPMQGGPVPKIGYTPSLGPTWGGGSSMSMQGGGSGISPFGSGGGSYDDGIPFMASGGSYTPQGVGGYDMPDESGYEFSGKNFAGDLYPVQLDTGFETPDVDFQMPWDWS